MHGLGHIRTRARSAVVAAVTLLMVAAHVVAVRYVSAHAVLPVTIVSAVAVVLAMKLFVLKPSNVTGRAAVRVNIACLIAILISACSAPAVRQTAGQDTATVRKELEALYQQNTDAYLRHDFTAIMALRAADFHAITPDGRTQDRATMETYIQGFLNGVKKWNRITFTIDSLRIGGDTAFAIVSQHLDRMALRPDNLVHHVETWVTQREAWIRARGTWLMWRVDQLRNQRRLIDGRPG